MGKPTLSKNKHGKDFKAHLTLRHNTAIQKRKSAKNEIKEAIEKRLKDNPALLAELKDLALRNEQAKVAREAGRVFPFPFGGSYAMVAAANAQVRADLYMEANHSPPNDSYVGTKYQGLFDYASRPAHAMLFYHHRAPRGSTGGLTSTGGSSFNKPWAEKLREHMLAGDYATAMMLDFRDILATTAPNFGYYALALHRTALFARNVGLINDAGLNKIATVYGQYLNGDAFALAFVDSDESV